MTAAELMIPRFEVIADYPGMEYFYLIKIGDILTDDGISAIKTQDNKAISVIEFENFPHIFRKMNWWENRHEHEMPKKLVSHFNDSRDVYKIEEWDMVDMLGWISKHERSCCSLLSVKPEYGYFPID